MQASNLGRRRFLAGTASAIATVSLGSSASHASGPQMADCTGGTAAPTQTEDGVVQHPEFYQLDLMTGYPPPQEKRVTIANWSDTPDNLRWTHLNTDIVFKALPVDRGTGHVWVLPRKMLEPERVNRQQVLWGKSSEDANHITVKEWLRRSQADAVIALCDGHIIWEEYFGKMTPQRRHVLWSASKSVLASILARFLNDGTLDETAPVTKYLPELAATGFQGATLRHLLDMQTGIDAPCFPSPRELHERGVKKAQEWTFGTSEFRRADNIFARTCRAQNMTPLLPSDSFQGYYDFLLTIGTLREHGEYFYYTDPNPMTLQWVLERTTGIAYLEHLNNLFAQLGCECNGSIFVDNIGTPISTIGLSLTLRDWARWGLMMCDGGRARDGQIVAGVRELVQDIGQNPQREKWTAKSNGPELFSRNTGYRSLCWASPAVGKPAIPFAHGAWHQKCYFDSERRLVLVKFSTLAGQDPGGITGGEFYGIDDVASQSFLDLLPALM
jgi:CubicO group peptidase (beta-lactamase class C family)